MSTIPILPNPSSTEPKIVWSPNHDREFIVVTDTVFLYRLNTTEPRATPSRVSSATPTPWKDFVAELAVSFPTLQQDVVTTDLAQLKATIMGTSPTSPSTYFQLLDSVKVASPAPNGIWVRYQGATPSSRPVGTNLPSPSSLAKMDVHSISAISWRPVNALLDATLQAVHSLANLPTQFSPSSPYIISIAYAEGWVWTVQLRPIPSTEAIPADIDDLEAYGASDQSPQQIPSSDYERFLADMAAGLPRPPATGTDHASESPTPRWPSRVAVVPPELSVRALAHNPTLPWLLAVGRGPRSRVPLLAVYDTYLQEDFLAQPDTPHGLTHAAGGARMSTAGETVLVPENAGPALGAPPLMGTTWCDASGACQPLASRVYVSEHDETLSLAWLPADPMVLLAGTAHRHLRFADMRVCGNWGAWPSDDLASLARLDYSPTTTAAADAALGGRGATSFSSLWHRRASAALVNTLVAPSYLHALTGGLVGAGTGTAAVKAHSGAVAHVVCDTASKLYVATADQAGAVHVWDLRTMRHGLPVATLGAGSERAWAYHDYTLGLLPVLHADARGCYGIDYNATPPTWPRAWGGEGAALSLAPRVEAPGSPAVTPTSASAWGSDGAWRVVGTEHGPPLVAPVFPRPPALPTSVTAHAATRDSACALMRQEASAAQATTPLAPRVGAAVAGSGAGAAPLSVLSWLSRRAERADVEVLLCRAASAVAAATEQKDVSPYTPQHAAPSPTQSATMTVPRARRLLAAAPASTLAALARVLQARLPRHLQSFVYADLLLAQPDARPATHANEHASEGDAAVRAHQALVPAPTRGPEAATAVPPLAALPRAVAPTRPQRSWLCLLPVHGAALHVFDVADTLLFSRRGQPGTQAATARLLAQRLELSMGEAAAADTAANGTAALTGNALSESGDAQVPAAQLVQLAPSAFAVVGCYRSFRARVRTLLPTAPAPPSLPSGSSASASASAVPTEAPPARLFGFGLHRDTQPALVTLSRALVPLFSAPDVLAHGCSLTHTLLAPSLCAAFGRARPLAAPQVQVYGTDGSVAAAGTLMAPTGSSAPTTPLALALSCAAALVDALLLQHAYHAGMLALFRPTAPTASRFLARDAVATTSALTCAPLALPADLAALRTQLHDALAAAAQAHAHVDAAFSAYLPPVLVAAYTTLHAHATLALATPNAAPADAAAFAARSLLRALPALLGGGGVLLTRARQRYSLDADANAQLLARTRAGLAALAQSALLLRVLLLRLAAARVSTARMVALVGKAQLLLRHPTYGYTLRPNTSPAVAATVRQSLLALLALPLPSTDAATLLAASSSPPTSPGASVTTRTHPLSPSPLPPALEGLLAASTPAAASSPDTPLASLLQPSVEVLLALTRATLDARAPALDLLPEAAQRPFLLALARTCAELSAWRDVAHATPAHIAAAQAAAARSASSSTARASGAAHADTRSVPVAVRLSSLARAAVLFNNPRAVTADGDDGQALLAPQAPPSLVLPSTPPLPSALALHRFLATGALSTAALWRLPGVHHAPHDYAALLGASVRVHGDALARAGESDGEGGDGELLGLKAAVTPLPWLLSLFHVYVHPARVPLVTIGPHQLQRVATPVGSSTSSSPVSASAASPPAQAAPSASSSALVATSPAHTVATPGEALSSPLAWGGWALDTDTQRNTALCATSLFHHAHALALMAVRALQECGRLADAVALALLLLEPAVALSCLDDWAASAARGVLCVVDDDCVLMPAGNDAELTATTAAATTTGTTTTSPLVEVHQVSAAAAATTAQADGAAAEAEVALVRAVALYVTGVMQALHAAHLAAAPNAGDATGPSLSAATRSALAAELTALVRLRPVLPVRFAALDAALAFIASPRVLAPQPPVAGSDPTPSALPPRALPHASVLAAPGLTPRLRIALAARYLSDFEFLAFCATETAALVPSPPPRPLPCYLDCPPRYSAVAPASPLALLPFTGLLAQDMHCARCQLDHPLLAVAAAAASPALLALRHCLQCSGAHAHPQPAPQTCSHALVANGRALSAHLLPRPSSRRHCYCAGCVLCLLRAHVDRSGDVQTAAALTTHCAALSAPFLSGAAHQPALHTLAGVSAHTVAGAAALAVHRDCGAPLEWAILSYLGDYTRLLKRADAKVAKAAFHVQRNALLRAIANTDLPRALVAAAIASALTERTAGDSPLAEETRALTDYFPELAAAVVAGEPPTAAPSVPALAATLSTLSVRTVPRCAKCLEPLAGGAGTGAPPELNPNCANCSKRWPLCALCLRPATEPPSETRSVALFGGETRGGGVQTTRQNAMFTWCVKCKHGGHAEHLGEWFKTNTQCPVTECECLCVTDFE